MHETTAIPSIASNSWEGRSNLSPSGNWVPAVGVAPVTTKTGLTGYITPLQWSQAAYVGCSAKRFRV